jgi:hypothetical protein
MDRKTNEGMSEWMNDSALLLIVINQTPSSYFARKQTKRQINKKKRNKHQPTNQINVNLIMSNYGFQIIFQCGCGWVEQ